MMEGGAFSSPRFHMVRSSRGRLVLFCLLALLGIVSLVAFLLLAGLRQVERKAESEVLGISAILNVRLAGVLQRTHAELERLAQRLPADAFAQSLVPTVRSDVARELTLLSRQFPELAAVRILDANGALLLASKGHQEGESFADQSYFKVFGNAGKRGLFFSETFSDPGTAARVLAVSMAVRRDGDALSAVLVALLDVNYLSSWFENVGLGENGLVSLRRDDDGALLLQGPLAASQARRPLSDYPQLQQTGAVAPSGVVRLQDPVDGLQRIYSVRRLGDYPLSLTVGLARDDYLVEWRRTCVFGSIAGFVLFLVLAVVLVCVMRAGRRELRTAARLRESEARYRMLAENSHDVIWTVDIPTRCYTYVSPSIRGMAGYCPEELIGKSFDLQLTPDSAARLAREIDLRLRRIASGDRGASVLVSEFEVLCKDGTQISTEVVSSYLLDEDGVARTILGITRNVSERKAAELALKESNRQLHARIEEIGRLQVALQELAVRDSLTGLYNRRYLDETLDREVSRARREGNPLSLVMLDIDYFKRVNDTYGHQVGDEVLRTLAATLAADIRAEDVACRYGGEEFLILLPNMPLETAIVRAEAWRAAVDRLAIAHGNFQLKFTISLGVSAYPDHGKTPDELTRYADQALYQAKREGRNRVSILSD